MGMVASLLRCYAAGSRDYESIPRCETDEMFFEEERLGPAARMSSGRRPRGTSFAMPPFFYVLAENWRKAALAFAEQAANDLKFGDERELMAASALLRSAKCYGQIEDKDERGVAATKHALEQAIALFVKKNDLEMAATSCVELAEFYMEHQKLQSALDSFEQAADYYGANRRSNRRYCRFKANLLRFTLDNEEMLRVKGFLPFKDCKRRSGRYIKSSDPDWAAQVSLLFSSTSITQPRL